MISALPLAIYAVTLGTAGAGWLREARWPSLAPRLAIAAWQALAVSVLLSLAASGLALAVSFRHVSKDIARLFNLCVSNLQHSYASPGGTLTAVLGLALFVILLGRALWCAGHAFVVDHRERASRVASIDLVGRRDVIPGAVVIEHAAPYAFCVGGRRRRIVLTSGLLTTLSAGELDAVLAHEQAHLRQRHHTALLACRALFGTLAPVFPAFREGMLLVRQYAELCADDSASRRVGSQQLRDALVRLVCMPAPAGALAASADDVESRITRLAERPRGLRLAGSAVAAAGIVAAVIVPLALAAAPALAIAWEGICLMS